MDLKADPWIRRTPPQFGFLDYLTHEIAAGEQEKAVALGLGTHANP